ncbi:MAG TPA: CBS domain-containing protein [Symbiobacteriaceae bacterium]|nr:CBS domain-containing protein [Symbiobacteriaceae bacterium]
MDIIIPHTNTDLDALGAAVGAQVLYPQASIVLPGSAGPLAAEFISLHRYYVRVKKARDIDLGQVKRAIVVDTADPARLGPLAAVRAHAEIHLYDHHPAEPDDLEGTLEVRDLVGATCTLLAELIEEAGAPLSPVQATAMLLGIYADTGSLTHAGTTDRDARAAGFLLSKGANLRAVDRFIQGALTPAQQALLRQLQEQGRWLTVRGARIRIVEGETAEYVGGLALTVHKLLEIQPAHALFAVVRMGERVYLVGRSEVPWVDVGQVLSRFGGGGHAGAASAVVRGSAGAEVAARLEAALDELVQRPLMARDVMSSPVKTIEETKPVREAERLMLRHGHSGLPVVDESGRLTGMISLRDLEKAQRHGYPNMPVKGIMVHKVYTTGPDTPLDELQDLMVTKDVGRVPVVEGESMVGIVTRSDLLEQLYGGPAPRWHRRLYTATAAPGPGDDPGADRVQDAVRTLPQAVRDLLVRAGQVAERQGVSAYAVGGFVRDLLIGRPNLDIDITVEGDVPTYAGALAELLGGRVQEVPRFRTAHIYLDAPLPDMPSRIDVATARREFYEHAAALPVVEHAALREDLYRRDFSINAMAIPLGPKGPAGLIDFFGGWQDLQDRQIRILHTLSFVEDPTRILRAVRFSHRYGFTLESETARCAREAVAQGFMDRVAIERLRNELILMWKEPRSGAAMGTLKRLGVLGKLLPAVDARFDGELQALLDGYEDLAATAPELYAEATPWLGKLMLLLHRLPLQDGVRMANRLKLRREQAQPLLHVLAFWRAAHDVATARRPDRGEIVRTLAQWDPDGLLLLCLRGGADRVLPYWREWRHVRLAITGADLIAAGVRAGPRIGRILTRVLRDRLDGRAPDRQSQMALALRYAKEV